MTASITVPQDQKDVTEGYDKSLLRGGLVFPPKKISRQHSHKKTLKPESSSPPHNIKLKYCIPCQMVF